MSGRVWAARTVSRIGTVSRAVLRHVENFNPVTESDGRGDSLALRLMVSEVRGRRPKRSTRSTASASPPALPRAAQGPRNSTRDFPSQPAWTPNHDQAREIRQPALHLIGAHHITESAQREHEHRAWAAIMSSSLNHPKYGCQPCPRAASLRRGAQSTFTRRRTDPLPGPTRTSTSASRRPPAPKRRPRSASMCAHASSTHGTTGPRMPSGPA